LQKLPESIPQRRQVLFLSALNSFYTGNFGGAIAALQQLPVTYDVLLNLGTAFSRKGDAESAMSAWQRAALLDPLASEAYFNMGYSSLLAGDFEAAERNLTASLKLRGRDSEALFLLGRAYARRGRPEDSRRLIARASRLSQRVERWNSQPIPRLERFAAATTFRSHEDIWTDRRLARRARIEDLSAWLEVVQNDIDSYMFGEALRELRDLMKIFPDSSEARSLLSEIDRQRNLR
jgi:tetratricopeptide (TPR) repeat protein